MWLRRRRSQFEDLGLPKKCFISHSYKDADARQRLLSLLPRGVEPFVFPPITVPPEQMVSDKLLNAIRDCDGLIYLQGGASAGSFWVALERDYALRVGKPVLVFNPSAQVLARDQSSAMDLRVFISYSHQQRDQARRIVDTMRKRFIDAWFDDDQISIGSEWQPTIVQGIDRALEAGGYAVVLWSSGALMSKWVESEMDYAERRHAGRVLFAVIEGEEPPILFKAANSPIVQVYGDDERSFVQRIDDLIVRLYWLIYRNTRQNQLS